MIMIQYEPSSIFRMLSIIERILRPERAYRGLGLKSLTEIHFAQHRLWIKLPGYLAGLSGAEDVGHDDKAECRYSVIFCQ